MTPSTWEINRFLPRWDEAGTHRIEVHARPEIVYEKVRALDLSDSWGIRSLFRLRGLPRSALTLEGLKAIRFAVLAENPPHEMVLGLVGRFWTVSGKLRRTNAQDFLTFAEPGYAKAVWSFSLDELREGTVILSTETRVLCLDESSRRSFRRYWTIIRPFSGWIRKRALRLVKDRAEKK